MFITPLEGEDKLKQIRKHFPHKKMRPAQIAALSDFLPFLEKGESIVAQLPTGSGKTAIGYALAQKFLEESPNPVFYVTPNKTQCDQIHKMYPENSIIVYGRNEYPCLFYKTQGKEVTTEDAPCGLIKCPHKPIVVPYETAEDLTEQMMGEPIAIGRNRAFYASEGELCKYYQAKLEALKGGKMVVCTTAFLIYERLFVKLFGEPSFIVLDEVHNLAKVIRVALSYHISDYTLQKILKLLEKIDPKNYVVINRFKERLVRLCKVKSNYQLLTQEETISLLDILMEVDTNELNRNISKAIRTGLLDPYEDFDTLQAVDNLSNKIGRYIKSLSYATSRDNKSPLNYIYTYHYTIREEEAKGKRRKIEDFLSINSYYVAPITKKFIMSSPCLGYSATIGDAKTFAFDTGFDAKFFDYPSTFPIENTRIYFPTDMPSLAFKERKNGDLGTIIDAIARTIKELNKLTIFSRVSAKKKTKIRFLVLCVSDLERKKITERFSEKGINVVTYHTEEGVKPKQTVEEFKAGNGDVLLGTIANYGEGLDLPKEVARAIFILRPSYPKPTDPQATFEDLKFPKNKWALWTWRAAIATLQARGRNIRSKEDRGVSFLMSAQFDRILGAAVPTWLKPAIVKANMKDCVKDAKKFLEGG